MTAGRLLGRPSLVPCAFARRRPATAALAFTDAMTRDIRVPDDVFADVRRHFDERQIVELSVLIGAYNMHTRVQEALKLDLEKPKP